MIPTVHGPRSELCRYRQLLKPYGEHIIIHILLWGFGRKKKKHTIKRVSGNGCRPAVKYFSRWFENLFSHVYARWGYSTLGAHEFTILFSRHANERHGKVKIETEKYYEIKTEFRWKSRKCIFFLNFFFLFKTNHKFKKKKNLL